MKNNPNPTYTIDVEHQPAKNNLRVTIPELGIVLETAPGKIKRDDATEVALSAISKWLHEHEHEQVQVKAS